MKQNIGRKTFSTDLTNLGYKMGCWQLWILKESGTIKNASLIYSWIVPLIDVQKGWQPTKVLVKDGYDFEGKRHTVELIEATFNGYTHIIQDAINGLLQGKNMVEIFEAFPDEIVPNEIVNFELKNDKRSEEYFIRPEIFLPHTELVECFNDNALPGPVKFGCYVSQIFFLKKKNHPLFQFIEKTISTQFSKKITDAFKTATGFNIIQESSPRLGNIEWYRFPLSDENISSLVEYKLQNNEDATSTFEITIPSNDISQSGTLLIRCRLMNDKEVILDQLEEINNGGTLQFLADEPTSRSLITIWEKTDNSSRAKLLYEESTVYMRNVIFQNNIVSQFINSNKLSILKRLQKKEQHQAKTLAQYSRSSNINETKINNSNLDPYIAVSRDIKTTMASLFPKKSEGKFFSNGWDERENESGQLSFVKWMLDTISPNEKCNIILTDPYFDDGGIELFSNVRTNNANYTIITCTQHRDKTDEVQPDSSLKKSHAKDIQEKCTNYEALLSGLNFSVYDLKSINGGDKPIFHDRYILITTEKSVPIKGFHLSNSIQGATRNAPLLITPIPSDILGGVVKYVDLLLPEVLNTPTANQVTFDQLYPLTANVNTNPPPKKNIENNLFDIGQIRMIYSIFLNDTNLIDMDKDKLPEYLLDSGMIESTSEDVELKKFEHEQIIRFINHLEILNKEDFKKYWGDFCVLLTHFSDESRFIILNEIGKLIKDNIEFKHRLFYLFESFKVLDKLITDRKDFCKILIDVEFEDTIENALIRFMNFSPSFGIPFQYTYTATLLVSNFPEDTYKYLEKVYETLKLTKWNEADPRVRALMLQTTILLKKFVSFQNRANIKIQRLLLNSKYANFRAVGSIAFVETLLGFTENRKLADPNQLLSILKESLCDIEYRIVVASIISFSRKDSLYAHLIDNWIGDKTDIILITTILYGPLIYNNSKAITAQFLIPLSESHHISLDEIFDHWNRIFIRKIQYDPITPNDNQYDKFVTNTDIELSYCLITILPKLSSEKQIQVFKNWMDMLVTIRSLITTPFAEHLGYHSFDKCCVSIYWVHSILNSLKQRKPSITSLSENIEEFNIQYSIPIKIASQYINNKRVLGIKDLVESLDALD